MMRFFILFFGLVFSLPGHPQQAPEHALKASYIYNFALLTEWPNSAQSNTLHLCLLGQDPIGPSLRSMEGKPVYQQTIKVVRITSLESARKCQIVFMGESESYRAPYILNELAAHPVLTITDIQGLSSSTLQLRIENERLVFDANLQRALKTQLKLSSKLLQLAKVVR